MHLTNNQTLQDKTGKNPVCSVFNEKQYLHYQALEKKIGGRLLSSNINLDINVLEKFHSRLLPVTYREWICR